MTTARTEAIRNRLLGCLPVEAIVTADAKRIRAELSASNAIPENRPRLRSFGAFSAERDEDEYLSRQGVPMAEHQNRRVATLMKPVQAFVNAHLNAVPTAEAVAEAVSAIGALRDAVSERGGANVVHEKVAERAWAVLAEAAERVCRIEALRCDQPTGQLVKGILLEASLNADPRGNDEDNEQFDESPSWGGGTVRIEAAQGVMQLARHPACIDAAVREAVHRLARDPSPKVRYQICRYLNALFETDRDGMWTLVEEAARHEPSRGVLQGLVDGAFDRLYWADQPRIADLTIEIFQRVRDGAGSDEVRERCVRILADAYSRFGHEGALQTLNRIADEPDADKHSAQVVVNFYRTAVVYGPTDPADPAKDAVRRRAIAFLSRLLDSVLRKHQSLVQTHPRRFIDWPEESREQASALIEVAAAIGSELYFGSGAYAASNGSTEVSPAVRARFYAEFYEIIGRLADVGEPSLAHHLLETVEFLIPVNAAGAFLLISRIVQGGRKGGYQYDSLAVNLLVRLVERYLADYRVVLRASDECRRALIETLDVFVDAGWPAARSLAYRLDEMYRV